MALVSVGCKADSTALLDLSSFPKSDFTISSAAGPQRFEVRLATTPRQQSQGLMFVRDLPASEGMLFVNHEPRPMSMWMKNTFIALDMLFIDARGRIVRIFQRTTPHSLDTLADPTPVKAVLELRGGECALRGIKVGDLAHHATFKAPRPGKPRTPVPVEAR